MLAQQHLSNLCGAAASYWEEPYAQGVEQSGDSVWSLNCFPIMVIPLGGWSHSCLGMPSHFVRGGHEIA